MSRVCWGATVEKYSQPYSAASAIGEEARPNIALIGLTVESSGPRLGLIMLCSTFNITCLNRTRANDLHIQQCYQVTQFFNGIFCQHENLDKNSLSLCDFFCWIMLIHLKPTLLCLIFK